MSDAVEVRRWMKELRETQGWRILQEYGDAQVKGRTDEIILTPAKSMEGALGLEFAKGEISGIRLFFHMPETIESIADAEVKARATTEEDHGPA
jgi:hypothetical protein